MPDIKDMQVFLKVAACQNLTHTGRALRMTPGAVTKRINKMESELGVRLLIRSTRQVSLTEAGMEYCEKASRILEDIEWLENSVSSFGEAPRGMIKITAPALFGRVQLSPMILRFRERYPDVQVHMQLTDRNVDLVAEGFDLAIRNSDLSDSSYIVRKLAEDRRVVCGAPSYFERRGIPERPEDLLNHDCLLLRFPGSRQYRWHFTVDGEPRSFLVKGPIDSNSSEVLYQWTLAGAGLSLRSTAEVADDLRAGRLRAVLTPYSRVGPNYNLLFPRKDLLPQKVRAFLDFLGEEIGRVPSWDRDLDL